MININRPTIKRKDLEYVLNCMILDKIDYGEFANIFEKKLKERTGIRNVVVINSVFNSILLILEALGLEEGDEVIIPSFAPQVYLNAVLLKKAVPVLIDMEEGIMKPSIKGLKNAVSEKTKAVIIKYYYGCSYDIQPYIDIYPNIIEDISTVLGVSYDDYKVGSKTRFSFSNFSSKDIITTGEGSAVFSNSKKDYQIIKSLLEIDYELDYKPRIPCLMPDLNAAMGVSQDESLNHRMNLRKKIGNFYEESIRRSHGTTIIHDESSESGLQCFSQRVYKSTANTNKQSISCTSMQTFVGVNRSICKR